MLPTKQRSLVPRSSSAASRLKGAPALGPKPETAIDAPSGKSLIASAGEVRSLSMCLACVRTIAVTRPVRAKNDRAAAVSGLSQVRRDHQYSHYSSPRIIILPAGPRPIARPPGHARADAAGPGARLASGLPRLAARNVRAELPVMSDRTRRRSRSCLTPDRRFLRQAPPGSSPYLEKPAASAPAGWLVTGSRWRPAEGTAVTSSYSGPDRSCPATRTPRSPARRW